MKTISRYIMTLALLLTAVTGAWATDGVILKELTVPSEWKTDENPLTADEMTGFKDFSSLTDDEAKALLNSVPTGNVIIFYGAGASSNSFKLVQKHGTKVAVGEVPLTHENLFSQKVDYDYKYYYTTSDAIEVTPGSSANTWTFAMPGSDVVLTPIYAKAAAFATTGTEPEVKTLLPAAAEGVIAGTDASLIADGTGIVAFAGTSTEVKQGTLMYAVTTTADAAPALTAFSATVPTAKDVADDGADVYVWYYIKGADAPANTEATEENTFNDTEPACLTVTVLTNKFNIQFNAANANTIEAGKATVTVGGAAATVTEGKLEGVKMGSEVKVKAKEGYKFRKVEVKKGGAPASTTLDNTITAWTAGSYSVPAGGLTYGDAITVSDDVTLTLTDGETLTLNKGISLAEGATLTVEGNGTMNVNGTNEFTASTVAGSTGTLILTSGTLNAKGGNGQSLTLTAGKDSWHFNIGASGGVAINGNVTVSGGTVTATGGNGGNLNTSDMGMSDSNCGGNGGAAISGTVTVNAGGWTATNGSNGTYTAGEDDTNCFAGTGGKAVAGTVTDNR